MKLGDLPEKETPKKLRVGRKFWDSQPTRKLLMSSPHQQLDCR